MCARKTALSGALNCTESEQPDSAVGLIRDYMTLIHKWTHTRRESTRCGFTRACAAKILAGIAQRARESCSENALLAIVTAAKNNLGDLLWMMKLRSGDEQKMRRRSQ
jgi:hypothetical protein